MKGPSPPPAPLFLPHKPNRTPLVYAVQVIGIISNVVRVITLQLVGSDSLDTPSLVDATPPFSAPGIVGCPPEWTDLRSAIQVNWTAPRRPNGIILRYYLVLTTFSGNTVIATATVNSSSNLATDFTARLGELAILCD